VDCDICSCLCLEIKNKGSRQALQASVFIRQEKIILSF